MLLKLIRQNRAKNLEDGKQAKLFGILNDGLPLWGPIVFDTID